MARYQRKPLIVDAWHFAANLLERDAVPAWLRDAAYKHPDVGGIKVYPTGTGVRADGEFAKFPHIEIVHATGKLRAVEGDYVVRGPAGDIYPASAEQFEDGHELVSLVLVQGEPEGKAKK